MLTVQVDLRKVNIQVLRPWIAKKVTEMIKFEDDVVVEYVFGMLEDRDVPVRTYTNI
jgi:serine/arginine repetitive matrix protein 1